MNQAIDILDAWEAWASGDPKLADQMLWGLKIVWWGRIGKFAAFVAGLILILDIVGPERVSRFTTEFRSKLEKPGCVPIFLGVQVVIYIGLNIAVPENAVKAGLIVAGASALLTLFFLGVQRLVLWAFKRDNFPIALRLGSLVLLVIGFHFDLLAS